MMIFVKAILLGSLLSVATAQSFPLFAQQLSPAENAAAQVQRNTGGQILAVRPTSQAGQSGFVVKVLLPNGVVRNVFVAQ